MEVLEVVVALIAIVNPLQRTPLEYASLIAIARLDATARLWVIFPDGISLRVPP